jgi:hypothetical protein
MTHRTDRGIRVGSPNEPNKIQAPDLIRRVASRLGLLQPHVLPSLAEQLQAVMVVDDLTLRPAPDRKPFAARFYPASGAGFFPNVFLVNPAANQKLVRMDHARLSSDVTGSTYLGLQVASALPATSANWTAQCVDTDAAGIPLASTCSPVVSRVADAVNYADGGFAPFDHFMTLAFTMNPIDLRGVVIMPGFMLVITHGAAASTLRGSVWFTEEDIPPSSARG